MLSSIMRMEFLKEGRSIRLPILMIFYNSILAFMTVLFIYFQNESMQVGYYTGRSSFLAEFFIVSSFQILSVFLIMPFSSSALEENERTVLTQFRVIPGVLHHYVISKVVVMTSMNLLIFISSLPIISLSCIYSGISLFTMCRLFGIIFLFSLWSGSLAVFCHSINRRIIFGFAATVFSYLMGTIGIIVFLEILRGMSYSALGGEAVPQSITGLCLFLNLFNPLTTYLGYYVNLTGNARIIVSYFGNFGLDATNTLFSFVYYKLAVVCCILMSVFFIYLSSRLFTHERGK